MAYHELTSLIWNRDGRDVSPQGLDSIIRQWLSEKAKELRASYGIGFGTHFAGTRNIYEILGLQQSTPSAGTSYTFPDTAHPDFPKQSTPETHADWLSGGNVMSMPSKPEKPKEEWWVCKACDGHRSNNDNFCGHCGLIRPVEKTLAEKFWDYMKSKNVSFTEFGLSAHMPVTNFSQELADIAEQHFSNGGR